MNKKIIIVVAGIIIVILAVGGVLLLNKKGDKTTNSSSSNSETTSEVSSENVGDLGLCKLVDIDTIKTALGSAVATLTGPDDTGTVSLGDGGRGQTCVYPFVGGGTITDSFYIDLAAYTQASFDNISSFTATDGTPVSGIGDRATFESSATSAINTKEFSLTVVKGTNVYIFAISQPADAVTFDDTTAQAALTTIAQSAKLN